MFHDYEGVNNNVMCYRTHYTFSLPAECCNYNFVCYYYSSLCIYDILAFLINICNIVTGDDDILKCWMVDAYAYRWQAQASCAI